MSAINPLIILPQALQTRAEALANELVASFKQRDWLRTLLRHLIQRLTAGQ
jgi:ABC-type amino acid transport system permease subunit